MRQLALAVLQLLLQHVPHLVVAMLVHQTVPLLVVATLVHQTVQPLVVPATNLIRSGKRDEVNIPKFKHLVQTC